MRHFTVVPDDLALPEHRGAEEGLIQMHVFREGKDKGEPKTSSRISRGLAPTVWQNKEKLTSQAAVHAFFAAEKPDGRWRAGSGAVWDLDSNHLRPAGWTSADAAGLPILPGLVRYDEVAAGAILHALRFTAPVTRKAYIYPARHHATDSTSASVPPMALRVRLRASANLSGLSPHAKTIAVALQRYGMILADNGSPWYVSGMSDPRFDDDVLHELDRFTGADLEAVDTTGFVNGE